MSDTIFLSVCLAGCTRSSSPAPFVTFTDITAASGIRFQHENGFDGEHWRIVETVNGGVALLDYDGDGFLDIYFTNGRRIAAGDPPPRNALYRSRGDGTFEDVSSRSGTGDESLSLGVAAADVDGDGRTDLYVTNLGPNRLYRNGGDGTFTDVAPAAGLAQPSMDSGAAFLDMDADGDLDLYVASYVIDDKPDQGPALVRGVPGYWPPLNYPPAPHHLYENLGDGRFTDVSAASGIRDVEPGRGLGVVAADLNDDGRQDIYVANDMSANYLFLGDGTGHFRDAALASGAAFGPEGEPGGSMGVAIADYDRDGRFDIFVTNYQSQIDNLFHAVREDFYEDVANVKGLSRDRLPEVAWGAAFPDLDSDGWRDLVVLNGHLNPRTHDMDPTTAYAQRARLYRNLGDGGFTEVASSTGEPFRKARVGRGAAFGDLDNDGDVDMVLASAAGPPEVLINEGAPRSSWVLIRLEGAGKNPDAIGARVTVTASGARQIQARMSSEGYLSANDPRIHFGLGGAAGIDRLEVHWPDGRADVHEKLPARALIVLSEEGAAARVAPLVPWKASR